jgi:glucose-1-phosphate thymidylyltransferase
MKGLILAGGTGSRLRPLTHTLPKQLLPLANKPVLEYAIEDLKDAGIHEIGIIVGGEHPGQIQSHLQTGERYDIDITYIMQGEPLGLAHAVGCARDFVGDDPFVVYFGDTIVERGVTSSIVSAFDSSTHDAGFLLQNVENPSRYGVAEFDGQEVVGVHEKPDEPPSDFAYVGVLILPPSTFDVIAEQSPSWRGEIELTDTLNQIVTRYSNIYWEEHNGLWKDVGTPEDVINTNREMLKRHEKQVLIGQETEISDGAEIKGPTIIGDNVKIGPEASIGPYASVGPGCEIDEADIRSSVVMERCTIDGDVSLDEIILGPNIDVINEQGRIQGIIGEDSKISI